MLGSKLTQNKTGRLECDKCLGDCMAEHGSTTISSELDSPEQPILEEWQRACHEEGEA